MHVRSSARWRDSTDPAQRGLHSGPEDKRQVWCERTKGFIGISYTCNSVLLMDVNICLDQLDFSRQTCNVVVNGVACSNW